MKRFYHLFFAISIFIGVISCNKNKDPKEIYHKKRDNIINIENKISYVPIKKILGKYNFTIFNKYILVEDWQDMEYIFHFFDKNTFEYVTKSGKIGQGPREITGRAQNRIILNNEKKELYSFDYGKLKIFRFELDSIIANKEYLPKEVLNMRKLTFPAFMEFLDDTTLIGRYAEVIKNETTFRHRLGKFNLKTGEIKEFGYFNPKVRTHIAGRGSFCISKKHNIYINPFVHKDLITICNLDGTLKYNIYGPLWDEKSSQLDLFFNPQMYNDKIIMMYKGEIAFKYDEYKRIKAARCTKLIIFDINGNYLKTLETDMYIRDFCIDEENRRILIYLDEKQDYFAYIKLSDIGL